MPQAELLGTYSVLIFVMFDGFFFFFKSLFTISYLFSLSDTPLQLFVHGISSAWLVLL